LLRKRKLRQQSGLARKKTREAVHRKKEKASEPNFFTVGSSWRRSWERLPRPKHHEAARTTQKKMKTVVEGAARQEFPGAARRLLEEIA